MSLNFAFSEEQERIMRTVRNFAENELKPKAMLWDQKQTFPWESIRELAKLGLTGLAIPEKYGGQETDAVTAGIVVEEVSRVDLHLSYCIYGVGVILSRLLAQKGAEKIKESWLPRLVSGETILGIALTEPDCGSDAAAIRTSATRRGSSYVLNGEKSFISFIKEAGAFVLFAKTAPDRGAKGISAFLIPTQSAGIKTTEFSHMGFRGASFGSITLTDVEVPEENLLGPENEGFRLIMSEFDISRPLVALMCIGAAQGALEDAINYAKARVAFGQPIARFEGVQFKIAQDYSEVEAARLLAYRALWMKDQNKRCTKESAMAKWFACEACFRAVNDALQIHGALGYTTETLQEQRLRAVRGLQIAEGTSEVMLMILARELLGSAYLPYS